MIQGTQGGAGLREQGGQLFIVRGVEAEHVDSDAGGWDGLAVGCGESQEAFGKQNRNESSPFRI